jgi:hypothetical protein
MMHRLKHFWLLGLIALLTLTGVSSMYAQDDEEARKQALVQIVASTPEFSEWLDGYANWQGAAYPPEDGTVWYVEFYNESGDEWLGYANVEANTGEIQDSFIPKPLPTDVYQAQLEKVQKLVLDDPEVLARLGDPVLWDMYPDYNRWEAVWDVYFYRGVDALLVKAAIEDAYFSISQISDPNELNEDQQVEDARNQAISLAYSAEGVDGALDGHDDWKTYAEPQGGSRWSVSFAAGEQELFYALVDIQSGAILAAEAGG